MYTNRIVNHDAVFALKYSGSTITSGRWFLYILVEIAYMFDGNYITPWGIGINTLLLYAISACVLVYVFNLKNNVLCCILGAVLITYPTVTSNNLYIFTAHYYALSFLLACTSVLLVYISDKIIAVIGSGILIALSLGIYQAYLPSILTIYVLLILLDSLGNSKTDLSIFKTALKFLSSLIAGLVLYFLINRLFLHLSGFKMDTYMGLNNMGKIDLSTIPILVSKCYSSFVGLFINKYHGINHKSWLRLLMLLCSLFVIYVSLLTAWKQKIRFLRTVYIFTAIILLPIAIGAIYIMTQTEKAICTMTVFSTVFIFIAPLCLADMLLENLTINKAFILKISLCVVLGVVPIYYSSLANETYISLEYANQNTNAYFTELATQIKSLDSFSPDLQVAFIGENQDDSIPVIDCDYIIRGTFTANELVNVYSREYFMTMHCGYSCNFISNTDTLAQDVRVQHMPSYPAAGSIAIIDGIIVVKFS